MQLIWLNHTVILDPSALSLRQADFQDVLKEILLKLSPELKLSSDMLNVELYDTNNLIIRGE